MQKSPDAKPGLFLSGDLRQADVLSEKPASFWRIQPPVPRRCAAWIVPGRHCRQDHVRVALDELRTARITIAVAAEVGAGGVAVHQQAEPGRLESHELRQRVTALAIEGETRWASQSRGRSVSDVDEDQTI